MSIGQKIRQFRKESKLTQEQLAKKSNVSLMTIRRYEKDERSPNIDILKKIAETLNVDISMLAGTKKLPIGSNFLYERNMLNLSKEEFSEITKIPLNRLELIESGEEDPTELELQSTVENLKKHVEGTEDEWKAEYYTIDSLAHQNEIDALTYDAYKKSYENAGIEMREELAILTPYRKLNSAGKEKVVQYALDLLEIKTYTDEPS